MGPIGLMGLMWDGGTNPSARHRAPRWYQTRRDFGPPSNKFMAPTPILSSRIVYICNLSDYTVRRAARLGCRLFLGIERALNGIH